MDRNFDVSLNYKEVLLSLSARRAWIEISMGGHEKSLRGSLSARRAWIEISLCGLLSMLTSCRSPQGERG